MTDFKASDSRWRLLGYQVDDDEIFKICTEYWNFLADDLYHKEVQMQRPMAALMLSPTPLAQSPRLQTYSPILAQARRILIDRMPKPEVCGTPLRTQTCRHIVGEGGSLSKTTHTPPPPPCYRATIFARFQQLCGVFWSRLAGKAERTCSTRASPLLATVTQHVGALAGGIGGGGRERRSCQGAPQGRRGAPKSPS